MTPDMHGEYVEIDGREVFVLCCPDTPQAEKERLARVALERRRRGLPTRPTLRLVSETSVPTAKYLIERIARGEHTREEIIEACRLWVKMQKKLEEER